MPPPLANLARLVEHVHGHLGWLSVAVLVHPAVLLRAGAPARARAGVAVGLAGAFVTVTAAMGVGLYPLYREQVKREIFETAPSLGWLFERKEHLAFGSLLLAWAGVAAYVGSRRATNDLVRERLRVTSQRAFLGASALALVTAVFGTIVAAYKSF